MFKKSTKILIATVLYSSISLAETNKINLETSSQTESPQTSVNGSENTVNKNNNLINELEEQSLKKAQENISDMQKNIAGQTGDPDNLIRPELLKVKNIEESVTNEVNTKREQIKTFIYGVASSIENDADVNVKVDEYGLSVEKLLEAKHKNNITVRSVKMTFEILSKINNELIKKAESETDPKKKRDLALQEAALVYEMADLTIEIVNDAVLDGSPILRKYKADEEGKINDDINSLKSTIEDLTKQYDEKKIDKTFFENMKKSYENQIEVNVTLLDKWKSIGVIFDDQDAQLDKIKNKVVTIENIKKNAEFQINILKRAKMAKAVYNTVGPVTSLIDITKDLTLIKLDASYFNDICVNGDCPKNAE